MKLRFGDPGAWFIICTLVVLGVISWVAQVFGISLDMSSKLLAYWIIVLVVSWWLALLLPDVALFMWAMVPTWLYFGVIQIASYNARHDEVSALWEPSYHVVNLMILMMLPCGLAFWRKPKG